MPIAARIVTRIVEQEDFSGLPSNGHTLIYNSTTRKFESSPASALGNITIGSTNIALGGSTSSLSDLTILSVSVANTLPAIIAKKAASGSENILEIQSSAGTVLSYINSAGNLGIRTSSILANTIFSTGAGNIGKVNYGSYHASNGFLNYQSYGGWDAIGSDDPGGSILSIGGYQSGTWSAVRLHASGSEVMRIGSSGVVIGNAITPSIPFAVYGPSTANGGLRFNMRIADNSALASGIGPGISFMYRHDGTNYLDCGGISAIKENATSGDSTTSLIFISRSSAGSLIERMRITGAGGVLIGTTTQNNKLLRVVGTSELAGTGGTPTGQATADPVLLVSSHAHTLSSLSASTEYPQVRFNLGTTTTFGAGNIALQRAFYIDQPTYAFTSSSTITTAATMQINGAPIAGANAALTESVALRVLTGRSTAKGLIVRGVASQTANLFEIQDSSSNIQSFFDSNYHLNSKIIISSQTAPSSSSDTGVTGEIRWDANYIYVCTTTNTWKRTAISTW